MNLWILSHMRSSPSIQLLLDTSRARGHDSLLLHPDDLDLFLASGAGPGVALHGQRVEELPAVFLTRLGSSAPETAFLALRHLALLGSRMFNKSRALERSRNKVRTFQRLAAAGLPLPPTVLLQSTALDEAIAAIPGPPWIVKLPAGFKGIGVVKVDSLSSLRSVIDTLRSFDAPLLLQRFLSEARGSDLRVVVIGGRAVAAMERSSREGDFRANLHQGGAAEAKALSPELAELAQRAALALDLDIAGVDLMESDRGLVIVEVNGSPGLEGISTASGINVAERVVCFLEQRLGVTTI